MQCVCSGFVVCFLCMMSVCSVWSFCVRSVCVRRLFNVSVHVEYGVSLWGV